MIIKRIIARNFHGGDVSRMGIILRPKESANFLAKVKPPLLVISPPNKTNKKTHAVRCAQDVRECPNGHIVHRNPFNNCEFDPCPCPENCDAWFDGCTGCTCLDGQLRFCMGKPCSEDDIGKPSFCSLCKEGMEWDPNQQMCVPMVLKCPIEFCSVWNTGCTTCKCVDGYLPSFSCDFTADCFPSDAAHCEECLEGYSPDKEGIKCIKDEIKCPKGCFRWSENGCDDCECTKDGIVGEKCTKNVCPFILS